MNLYIIYGSESSLIQPLYLQHDFYIRIYNQTKPSNLKNSLDIHINELSSLRDQIKMITKKVAVEKIIFIGAAFKSDNSLVVNYSNENVRDLAGINIMNYVLIVREVLRGCDISLEKIFIYLSSFRAIRPAKGAAFYSASKAFGEMFFRSLNEEYGRINLRSTIIRMGYFDGRMMDIFDQEVIRKTLKKISVGRLGSSSELIAAIKFIIDNPYTAGGVIDLNGGLNSD